MVDTSSRREQSRARLFALVTAIACIVFLFTRSVAAGEGLQQRFEVDHSSGRIVLNEWTFGLREIAAIDPGRGIVYGADVGDPVAVKAFSLEDGSVVATLGGDEGEGPGELKFLVAVDATAQGVLAASPAKVNHWSLNGTLVGEWRPLVPGLRGVCALDGDRMTVPLQADGVLLRQANGEELTLGTGQPGSTLHVDDLSSVDDAISRYMDKKIVCVGDYAYVLGGDRLVGYSVTGDRHEVPLPVELTDAGRLRRESARIPGTIDPYTMFRDDQGRLVISMWRSRLAAVVLDPVTGCHAIVADPSPSAGRRYVGMYRDSILAFESPPVTRIIDGRPRQVVYAGEASVVALRPLVPTGGEPCRPSAARETGQLGAK